MESQSLSDFRLVDLVSGLADDLHLAGWWWSGVGDGTRGRHHRYVESERDVLLADLVQALDAVGLRVVGHEFLVSLDNHGEAGDTIDVGQTAGAEGNLELLGGVSSLVEGQVSSALLVTAVVFHVEDTTEGLAVSNQGHENSVGQTLDVQVLLVRWWRYHLGYFCNKQVAISLK